MNTMRKGKHMTVAGLAGLLLLGSGWAPAALEGLDPGYPRIDYNSTGVTTFVAATGAFSVDADPLYLQLTAGDPLFVGPYRDVKMSAALAPDCSLQPGAPGSLTVEGVVYDANFNPIKSGILLTGDISGFNAGVAVLNGQFELKFSATGGALVADGEISAGTSIGVTLTAEGSNFPGDCATDWSGGAKGVIGTLPAELASLGDRVWEDLNNNGIQDCTDSNGNGILGDVDPLDPANPGVSDQGAECGDRANGGAGIPGVDVYLYQPDANGDCSISMGRQTATGSDGLYLFDDLAPGDYCVRFALDSLPADFCATSGYPLGAPQFTDQGLGGDEARDSDADQSDGSTDGVTLAIGDVYRYLDAGIVCPAKIGNYVWEDLNQDGLQDGNEPGVGGISVNLYDCGPDGVAGTGDDSATGETRLTDAGGMYMFGAEPGVFDLQPGDYYVQFDPASLPAGYAFTTPRVPGGDDASDSDCLAPGGNTACTTLGSRGINLDRDCGITPVCGLAIDKQCRVETPPTVSDDAKCDGKLKQFTVTWTGGQVNISGLPNDAPGGVVNTNQEVTFFGPFASNDVFIDISGASVSGQSKFHMSCSDSDMDGASDSNDAQPQVSVIGRDCGKNQGDAKSNGDPNFINDWLLEGFIDNSDQVLDCTVPDSGDGFDQDCSFTAGPGPNCESLGTKPTSLTFKYTGGGCSEGDNTQDPSKAVCTPAPAGSVVSGDITVLYAGSDSNLASNAYNVDMTAVASGGTFTVSAGSFSSNSYLQIGDGSATELNMFHTSCSQPLAVGDVFGSLTLVGLNGQTGGVDVSYQYTVTNSGAPLTGVTVSDDLLGAVGAPFDLDFGQTMVLATGPVGISETTTNVATVSAPGTLCVDSDSVTVTAVEPVCDVAIAFDRLDDDKVKYKLTNTSGIVATLDTFVLDFPAAYGTIKEVKLDGGIYKASESTLVVAPGDVIGTGDWTKADVSKRELDPGETRTLEVVFTTKHKGGDWALMTGGGMVSFEEGCAVSLRAPNACEIERPTELVFEYTGDACSATTNTQDGGFKCEPAAGGPIGSLLDVVMTKDVDKFGVHYTGTGFSIYRSDDPGREFPSEIKYDVIGSGGTQSQVLHTSCSKPLNLDDRFGALILREFYPKTH